ncbi:MAG: ATP-binding protein [Gemmatimonadaceae bacterium]
MPANDPSPTPSEGRPLAASDTPDTPEAAELPASEVREREAAWRRGESRDGATGREPARDPYTGLAPAGVAARAFAALSENVRDYAIFLLDPKGVITFWGEGSRLIKWWTKAQAEGAHLRLLYPAGGSEDGTAEDHVQMAAERGEYTGEGQRVRSDGSTFWGGVTLTALWDDEGTLLGFAKTTRDLTARRAADALLHSAAVAAEEARAAAEAASRAKSDFLATMSHEIRTPVNAIIGYHELLDLETDGPLTPGQRRHLARASASGRHLVSIITEVLDFSRLEAERVTVRRAAFRVGDIVATALDLVAPDVRARGLELADAVSGAAAGLAAWGDEGRVRQILTNLLANAVKFTATREGEPGRVTVSAGTATQASPDAQLSGDGPWVYVRVEDTGQGIPSDQLEAIFQPFVQADMSLTRQHGGTGLGLAISRRLARLMGGDVTARSEVDVGSSFFLWLPAHPVESLQNSGLEGQGPREQASGEAPAPGSPLGEVAEVVRAERERVLHACVARLRSDPGTPSAHAVSEPEVEDNLASFLAHLAGTLASLDVPSAGVTDAARDVAAIQRVFADAHGAERARLGWTEGEVRREFTILTEELAAAIRRRAPAVLRRRGEAERARERLNEVVAVAERLSLESYRRAAGARETTRGD